MTNSTQTPMATTTQSGELSPAKANGAEQAKMQAALFQAAQNPRDEDRAFNGITKACQRESLACKALYEFPIGDDTLAGPSVYLARELARQWGNIQYGFDVIFSDEEKITIEGWAWDIERNIRISSQSNFRKMVYRKSDGWINANERQLRELMARHGAIATRNAILQVIPSYIIDEAKETCRQTMRKEIDTNLPERKSACRDRFLKLGITEEQLSAFFKKPWANVDATDIQVLGAIFNALNEGHAKWDDYHNEVPEKAAELARKARKNAKAN